jgi:hypothetical protein
MARAASGDVIGDLIAMVPWFLLVSVTAPASEPSRMR